jgi:3-oxoadipate enol-lactonase
MSGLNTERAGTGGGHTLVLLHPMGADLRFWDDCRRRWESRFDCLAIGLPGAGASEDPGGILTPQRQAAVLSDHLASEMVTQCAVIGCAVGAMVAVALAARRPEFVAALALANPGLRTEGAARDSLAARAAAARIGGMQAIASAALDAAFDGQPDDDRRAAYARRFVSQDPSAYARQIEGILDADIGPELATITCPVFVAVGGRDRLLPPEIGRGIAARVPGAALKEYPEAAHFIPLQSPDRFAADVAAWLDRIPGFAGQGPHERYRN